MKEDERLLLDFLRRGAAIGISVRASIAVQDLVPPKRCWYLLGKWTRKGWYDYGVSIDLGWFTAAGKEAVL